MSAASTLRFRNLDISPDDPLESWPLEAVHAALARGSLREWRRIAAAIREEPWGRTARQVEEVLGVERPYGVAAAMQRIIARTREGVEAQARREVAAGLAELVRRSGLSRAEFASRLGTSASRLSTYLTGTVTPSASLVVRARAVAARSVGRRAASPI